LHRHPSNAVWFQGHWYAYYPEKITWVEAKKRSQELGGYLACIRGLEEQQFALKLTNRGDAWLGGFNDATKKWFWLTGEPIATFFWANGQPDNGPGVFLQLAPTHPTSVGMKCWHDVDPPEQKIFPAGFICQWDF